MRNHSKGHFYVGVLADGRFVAASASEPYFCFRAETEDAVLSKLKKALAFYRQENGDQAHVHLSKSAVSVTALPANGRRKMTELLEAA